MPPHLHGGVSAYPSKKKRRYLCHITKGTSFSFSLGKGILFLPLGRDAGFFLLPEAGGRVVLFSKARMVLCVAKYTYQKRFFADRTAILGGKAGSPALRLRLFCADFQSVPACTTTVLLQVLQGLAVVIHFTQSLYGLSLSRLRQTIAFCFLSVLQLLQIQRIPTSLLPLPLSKGKEWKREGEASFPFLCFWFLLSQYKRNMLFSFPWKRNALPSSWRRCRFVPAYHSRGTMVLFLSAGKGYVAFGVHQKCPPQIACGRMVVFQQDGHDGVERQSGSIGANHFEHLGSTVLAEYQDGGQHLGNGLDTETVLRVTQLDDFSVHQTDTDSEQFGINICQIRDVVGVLTICIVLVQIVSLLGNILYLLDSYSSFHKLI